MRNDVLKVEKWKKEEWKSHENMEEDWSSPALLEPGRGSDPGINLEKKNLMFDFSEATKGPNGELISELVNTLSLSVQRFCLVFHILCRMFLWFVEGGRLIRLVAPGRRPEERYEFEKPMRMPDRFF